MGFRHCFGIFRSEFCQHTCRLLVFGVLGTDMIALGLNCKQVRRLSSQCSVRMVSLFTNAAYFPSQTRYSREKIIVLTFSFKFMTLVMPRLSKYSSVPSVDPSLSSISSQGYLARSVLRKRLSRHLLVYSSLL